MRMGRHFGIAVALALAFAGSAHAQSYVSGVGDDANPCSRTAPCATLAGALGKTAAGGEIDILDPGDFGSVTITGAITIVGPMDGGQTSFAGLEGITIAAGAGDVVSVRGVSVGGSGTGTGITITGGGEVRLDQVFVYGFADGISFKPSGGGQLQASGVVSKDNSGSGFVAGLSGGSAHMTLVDCRAEDNGVGIRAIAGGVIDVYDSDASHNVTAGVSADLDGSGGASEINLESVDASENGIGVQASAAAGSAIVRLSKVLGTANATAPVLAVGNGELLSFGNNRLDVVAAIALSSTAPSANVNAGAAVDYPVSVNVTGLLSAPISFACSNLPPGASCAFSPATLTGITTGATTVTVTTTSLEGPDGGGFVVPRLPPVAPLLLVLILGAFAWMMKRPSARRPLGAALAAVAFAVVVASIAACGSSANHSGDMATGEPGNGDMSSDDMSAGGDDMSVGDMGTSDMTLPYTPTPPGTYNITVTATAGAVTATLPLTLVVQ
jgi:hypothetical protein